VIVLDTNVVSEASRPRPLAKVLDWMRAQPLTSLFITAITEAELLYGIELLPAGRRRQSLEEIVRGVIEEDFRGRILPFDSPAAREFATIAAMRRRSGRPITDADARIAAITRSRGAGLATRNASDFIDCNLQIINAWL
jgi:toxin FitB